MVLYGITEIPNLVAENLRCYSSGSIGQSVGCVGIQRQYHIVKPIDGETVLALDICLWPGISWVTEVLVAIYTIMELLLSILFTAPSQFLHAAYQWYTGAFDDRKTETQKEFDKLSASHRMAIRLGVKNAKIVRNGEVEIFKLEDYQRFVDQYDPDKQTEINLIEDVADADNVYDIAKIEPSK